MFARLFLMLQRFPVESKGRRKKLQEVFTSAQIIIYIFVILCFCFLMAAVDAVFDRLAM